MQRKFKISTTREFNFFLDLQIKQENEGIFINQTKYIKQILKKFGINDKSLGTPMSNTCKLSKDEKGKTIDQKLYQGMIRSPLYLTVSRQDIMFSVYIYSRFQSSPRKSYLIATKRIFRYLVSMQSIRLWCS